MIELCASDRGVTVCGCILALATNLGDIVATNTAMIFANTTAAAAVPIATSALSTATAPISTFSSSEHDGE